MKLGNLKKEGLAMKKTSLAFLALFLVNPFSIFARSSDNRQTVAQNVLIKNIIKRFALIKTSNNLLPALMLGGNYIIVPANSIYEEVGNSRILKEFTISYEEHEFSRSQVKVVADYKGVVLLEIVSPFNKNLPILALAPPKGWGEKIYYVQFFLYKSGTSLKSFLLAEEAKIVAISDGLFFIDKGFFGSFYGLGVFNEEGQLVGIAIDNMSVVFEGTNFSMPRYGIVISSQTFGHFNIVIRQPKK